jgi:hypothetical protein
VSVFCKRCSDAMPLRYEELRTAAWSTACPATKIATRYSQRVLPATVLEWLLVRQSGWHLYVSHNRSDEPIRVLVVLRNAASVYDYVAQAEKWVCLDGWTGVD